MRNRLLQGLTAAGLLAGLAVLSASAQAATLRFTIPFDFTVQDTTLSAGSYTISTERDSQLFVLGQKGGVVTIANRREPRGHHAAQLVFHKYGETLILRQVWLGNGIVRDLPRTRTEKELIRTAQNGRTARVEEVVVPAS
jgi:hypothetical protein